MTCAYVQEATFLRSSERHGILGGCVSLVVMLMSAHLSYCAAFELYLPMFSVTKWWKGYRTLLQWLFQKNMQYKDRKMTGTVQWPYKHSLCLTTLFCSVWRDTVHKGWQNNVTL